MLNNYLFLLSKRYKYIKKMDTSSYYSNVYPLVLSFYVSLFYIHTYIAYPVARNACTRSPGAGSVPAGQAE
jgi:hypothetical protein